MLGEKAPRSHARHGFMGRTGPHKDPQLSTSVGKVAIGAPPPTNCECRDSDGTRASPENQQGTHISSVAGWGECTSKRTIRSPMVNVLHPEANGYAKRLLADLQALALVPKWAEQTTNVEEDLEGRFPIGQQMKRVVYWAGYETVSAFFHAEGGST